MAINYQDSYECRNLYYKDMDGMTTEDAIFILQKHVDEYHEAEKKRSSSAMVYLPKARLIRAYELAIESMKKDGARET